MKLNFFETFFIFDVKKHVCAEFKYINTKNMENKMSTFQKRFIKLKKIFEKIELSNSYSLN